MKYEIKQRWSFIFSGFAYLRSIMTRSQLVTRPQTAYGKIYTYLRDAQVSRLDAIIRIVATTVLGAVFSLSIIQFGWVATAVVTFFFTIICYLAIICAIVAWKALGFGTEENTLIILAQAFIEKSSFTDADLEAIRIRSEISSAVGPIRSLLPILLAPIVISFLGDLQNAPITNFLFVLLIIIILFVPLIIDMYRTTIDSIIRHALAQHCCDSKKQQSSSSGKNIELLQILIKTPWGK